jgi:hypothetical protein
MSRLIKKITHKLKLLSARYQRFIPLNYQAEDIFLVSYPKSGNTWFRFLLANTLILHFSIHRKVNFFSIQEIIPDIYMSRQIATRGFFQEYRLPRIIKSHASYNPYYKRVILLVRNPSDVCLSYYHYLRQRQAISESKSLTQFIREPKHGIAAWLAHTQSWYRSFHDSQIVKVIRYEDLISNPQQVLAECLDLLGLEVKPEIIEKAIQLSSKAAMKASEQKHISTYLIKSKTLNFVRDNQSEYNIKLSTKDREYIENLTKDISQKLGYKY